MAQRDGKGRAGAQPAAGPDSNEWVSEGVRQYIALLESADPLAIAVQMALWQANHAQYLANSRAIEALRLPVSITGTRLAMMRILYCAPNKELPLKDIARGAGISPTMVTNLVDSLARAGLVRRVGSAADRRVSLAKLTKEGEETFRRVLPVISERMTAACAAFTDEEKRQLIGLLQRLF